MRAVRMMVAVIAVIGTTRAPNHAVVMHIESFTSQAVDIHVKATPSGLQVVNRTGLPLPSDTLSKAELTVATPADIRISADVQTLEVSTPDNRAVKVKFTDGATEVEKRVAWGRLLIFKRVNGNLQASPKVIPVEPAGAEH